MHVYFEALGLESVKCIRKPAKSMTLAEVELRRDSPPQTEPHRSGSMSPSIAETMKVMTQASEAMVPSCRVGKPVILPNLASGASIGDRIEPCKFCCC